MTVPVDLARLALAPDDRRRPLYWRGPARPDPTGTGLRLSADAVADFGTWFNAAPVAWWRALLPDVAVDLVVSGTGELTITTLDAAGGVRSRRVDIARTARIPVRDDAIWCWTTWRAGPEPAHLDSHCWVARDIGEGPSPMITAVVPTFRREHAALAQLRRLLDPALAGVIARVILVDQSGTLRAAPGSADMAARAGSRLVLCEQDNLGGSGGFARGMLEALAFPDDAVLLLDDDAVIDPEGLRRMLAASTLCRAAGRPTIVGTPLFSAERPTWLTALAEAVNPVGFRWGPSDGVRTPVDLSGSSPIGWGFARPGARTDYTGWWGTLLPVGAVAELGLPAPYFLKWDDAEYGLRARRAGYRICALPGTGVWHPTWAGKGTAASWAAQPLHRNRLATAAGYGAGRSVLIDSLVHQAKHVLSLQYDTADLWDDGLAQFLAGPGWLSGGWRGTRDRAEAVLPAPADATIAEAMATTGTGRSAGRGPADRLRAAATAVVGLIRPNELRDVVAVPAADFHWSDALGRDAVVLEGSGRIIVRDPGLARCALLRTLRLHGRAALRWRALVRGYGEALPGGSTADRWRTVLDASSPDQGPGPGRTDR